VYAHDVGAAIASLKGATMGIYEARSNSVAGHVDITALNKPTFTLD